MIMVAVNSNCSRIDAVKAMSKQLQMQVDQAPHSTPESESYRKAQSQVQALDSQIKTGNAQQAETALSTATTAVMQLDAQNPTTDNLRSGLDVYA
jgi:hypothetical protein